MPHDDRLRHVDVGEDGCLERRDIGIAGRLIRVGREIEQGRRHIGDRLESLIGVAARAQLRQEILRDRLPGLVMQREAAQNLRLLEPVLIELRGKLDEVAADIGARDHRVGDVGQQAVQGVAELMEQRSGIVEDRSVGSPGADFEKFITLTMIGRTSALSFSWPR